MLISLPNLLLISTPYYYTCNKTCNSTAGYFRKYNYIPEDIT